ncbi:hypothetical protein P154DRAFT_301707 [Amniculicola lignicola CBS 123094]|uniref:Uncharacterized protein n=1 Tax=Amniculicola lignicola CBS 123094 TaxID=1392246 RepID=A0A6A5W4N0_9PLEO|nr:hypothetical protein P154DRAFT_301707 [Amniculicola lignicola CBS 123094]
MEAASHSVMYYISQLFSCLLFAAFFSIQPHSGSPGGAVRLVAICHSAEDLVTLEPCDKRQDLAHDGAGKP